MRSTLRSITALALLTLGLLALIVPASAATTRLEFSPDGSTWSANLSAPLFDPSFRWVPGDEKIESFFVRNRSTEDARLAVDLLGTGRDDLTSDGELSVAARAGSDEFATSRTTTGCNRLIAEVSLAPQQVQRIDVRVGVDFATPNAAQRDATDLDLQVRLREDVDGSTSPSSSCGSAEPGAGGPDSGNPGGGDPGSGDPGSGGTVNDGTGTPGGSGPLTPATQVGPIGGLLPNTGAPAFWSIAVGGLLLVSGIIVTLGRRKEEAVHV